MKKKKSFEYKKYLSSLFASAAVLSVGTMSLLSNGAIDYYTVLDTLTKMVPAVIVLGGLGWVMGSIIDKPKKRDKAAYNNVLLDELIKETGFAPSEKTENETETENETSQP